MTAHLGGICVGFGGLELAIEQHIAVDHTWHVEWDENASKVLKARWPEVPNHGDVTAVDWTQVDPIDIFAGGVPCQGYSAAGNRKGSDDDRDLWPVRKFEADGVTPRRGALDAIRTLRPRLAVIENVPGMLTSRSGQDFATILADLDGLGYTVSWTTIGACKVGACHHRHRVFIAATLNQVPAPVSDPVAHRSGAGWVPAQFVLFGNTSAVRWPASGFTSHGTAWQLPVETCGFSGSAPPTPLSSDGSGGGQDEAKRRLGGHTIQLPDAVISMLPTPRTSDTNGVGVHGTGGLDLRTAVAMFPTPMTSDGEQTRTSPGDLARKSPALAAVVSLLPTPRASDGEKGGPNQRGSSGDVMLPAAVQPQRFWKYAAAVHRHEVAFGLVAPDPTAPGRNGKPRLSAEFPEFMMGLTPGWLTDVVDRNAALKLAGNGVNPRQAAYALSTLPTFRSAVAELTSLAEVAA